MSNEGLIIKNMDPSHIHLAVHSKIIIQIGKSDWDL